MALSLLLPPIAATAQSHPTQQPATASSQASDAQTERVIHDPYTGKSYRQQVVSVPVTQTQWEVKPVTTTVYEPATTTRFVDAPRTVYVPHQSYVVQPRIRGLWNPFRQPVQTHEFVPVTQWVATLQTQKVPLTSQNWVAKERTYYVYQPVQKKAEQQQVVLTEIPAPNNLRPQVMYANQPTPRVRIPLLARQQVLPNSLIPSRSPTSPTQASGSPLLALSPQSRTSVPGSTMSSGGLRAISGATASFGSSAYSAPLRTAAVSGSQARDAMQSGMTATVLR